MSAHDGGPAFPITEGFDPPDPDTKAVRCHTISGMTLRDYFAAQAVAGLMSMALPSDADWNPARDAKAAYQIADAMLAAR